MKQMNTQGFMALTGVLILSAIFLSVSITLITHALSGEDQALSTYFRNRAEATSEACVEYALLQIRQALDYAGNESILIGEETCDILSIEGLGDISRTVQTQSTVSGHTYRTEVIIEAVSPEIEVASWKTVTDF